VAAKETFHLRRQYRIPPNRAGRHFNAQPKPVKGNNYKRGRGEISKRRGIKVEWEIKWETQSIDRKSCDREECGENTNRVAEWPNMRQ
jgi:hypothetical protein